MSLAPIPAHQALPKNTALRAESVTYGRQPVPAHKIVARNGVPVTSEQAAADPSRYSTETPKAGKPFSFWDLVDIVNPLQHIPGVNTLYRELTGDTINNFSRIAGGGLFGGLLGAAVGGINAIMVDNTGKDVGQTVMASLGFSTRVDDAPAAQPAAMVANNATSITSQPLAPARTTAPATSHALFDGPASSTGHSAPSVITPDAPKPSIPVIEVRPQATRDAKPSLPVPKDVANLAELEPGNAQPVQRDKVQQAMMDALLKMQESQNEALAADANADAKI